MTDLKFAISAVVIVGTVLLEAAYARARGRAFYRFEDAIISLASFFSTEVVTLFMLPFVALCYDRISEQWGLFHFSMRSPRDLALCLLGADFCYYWMHRALHRVNLLWAFHVVHHQSTEYNLSVGPRKAWFSKATYPFFYLPLPFLGFPTLMIFLCISIDAFFQYFLHTRAVGRLGPLELVFCTPSNHRVHHGTDPEYVDKNFGGIFILWDRLFGSFAEERQEPSYGTIHPLNDRSLIEANLHHWKRMAEIYRSARGLREKLGAIFAPPEWAPAGARERGAREVKSLDWAASAWPRWAITALFAGTTALAVVILELQERWSHTWLALLAIPCVIAFIVLSRLASPKKLLPEELSND